MSFQITWISILVMAGFSACEHQPVQTLSPSPTVISTTQVEKNNNLIYLEEFAKLQESPQPILVILHGYGDNERGILPLGKSIDPRFYVISVRAPIELGKDRFAWFKSRGKSTRREVEAQAKKIITLIEELPRTAFEQGSGPDTKKRAPLFVAGFSQGGRMALEVGKLLTQQNRVLLQGIIAFSPATFSADTLSIPTWVSHGANDSVVPFQSIKNEIQILKQKDAPITFFTFHGGHQIPFAVRRKVQEWTSKQLLNSEK